MIKWPYIEAGFFCLAWGLLVCLFLSPLRAFSFGIHRGVDPVLLLALLMAGSIPSFYMGTRISLRLRTSLMFVALNCLVPLLYWKIWFFQEEHGFVVAVEESGYQTSSHGRAAPFDNFSLQYDEDMGFWVMD